MPYQNKPLPPNMDDVKRKTTKLWKMGYNDLDILHELFYAKAYGLGLRKFRELRRKWGLQSARCCQLTDEDLREKIKSFKVFYPDSGARPIVVHLRVHHQVKVPLAKISKMLRSLEPDAVLRRKPMI